MRNLHSISYLDMPSPLAEFKLVLTLSTPDRFSSTYAPYSIRQRI